MATLDELRRLDMHQVAEWLGLERPHGRGNYRSPAHADNNPSLSVYDGKDGVHHFKDFSGEAHGDNVDLVQHVLRMETADAIRWLHEAAGLPLSRPDRPAERREKSRAEYIADRCRDDTAPALEYLIGRGIHEDVAKRAIGRGAVGFNRWESAQIPAGQFGHGGPAAAFIVRSLNPGRVVAVDLRYLDVELNGGCKTQTQGEKEGYVWYSDLAALRRAHTVYVVESPINALSVDCAEIPGAVAVAARGVNVDGIDWRFLAGKRVVACFDNDKPQEDGRRPGPEAAWRLLEILTGFNTVCHLVDQAQWQVNDVNDVLQAEGAQKLRARLKMLEPWAIPGLPGKNDPRDGRHRVFLPAHDFGVYWKFRVKEDFTSVVDEVEKDDEGERESFSDLAGFRIAAISRITIQSASATMTGDTDTSPKTVFGISAQAGHYGDKLIRRVWEEEELFNIDKWKRLGPVWNPGLFLRLVSILGRVSHIGARDAVNFVGVAWRKGKLVVNEGPDCFFVDPEKQCPYHALQFPSGPVESARQVIAAYQATFSDNAAALLLAWALGGHLKALLGFYPHCMMQADKGKGKSTLIKRLERSIGMTMFSGQSLQTEFRLLTSIGHTSHPVGWEELSARKQETIDKAVALLQESYQYTITRRGADLVEFLNTAPVLLAGEDVPVRSMLGKLVRVELVRKGEQIPVELPVFPVREWLKFVASLQRKRVVDLHAEIEKDLWRACRAAGQEDGVRRMVTNYSALALAWRLICEFAGIEETQGGFREDLIRAMNSHISETSTDREPWIWIMEIVCAEISSGNFRQPHQFKAMDGKDCLLIRAQSVMHHIKTSPGLRDTWNGLPVKSDRVFKRQLITAGVVHKDRVDTTIEQKRECHMLALDLEQLEKFGLVVSQPEEFTY